MICGSSKGAGFSFVNFITKNVGINFIGISIGTKDSIFKTKSYKAITRIVVVMKIDFIQPPMVYLNN